MTRLLSVDVGGSHVACAVVADGRVERRSEFPVRDTRSWIALLPSLEKCLAGLSDMGEVAGLTIAFPALVDGGNRVVSTPKGKYEDATGLDFQLWARSRLGLDVRIELDGRMALLGERHAGALRGEDDAALLALGTGIGTAVVMNGRLVSGRHGQAAALGGHLSLGADGPACICGSVGCIEAHASTWALPRLVATIRPYSGALDREIDGGFEAVFRLAREGDEGARRVRDHCVAMWATAALNLVHAYDASVVLVTGGVAAAPEVVPAIREHVTRHAWTSWGRPEVRAGVLGADAALLGAEPLWEARP